MRKKFWPRIFSRVKIPANTSANAKVMIVTVTISSTVFCIAVINFTSPNSVTKLLIPTKVSVGEYAPRSNRDIRKTFRVGRIMNTRNRIVAGAKQNSRNPILLLSDFNESNPFLLLYHHFDIDLFRQ